MDFEDFNTISNIEGEIKGFSKLIECYFSTDITINEINDFFRDNLKDKKYMLYKYLWT